jgi:6,7-dimethyl-8-ribityllumazine synthase
MEIGQYQPNLDGDGLRIGIVQARFNEPVCNGLADSCIEELERLGVTGEDVLLVTVPGALEIPLALQKLAESAQFDALIALGAVIRGETYHFELVSNAYQPRFRHSGRERRADHGKRRASRRAYDREGS